MPFGLNVLYYLLEDGYEVEIDLLENYSEKYHEILHSKPRINFIGNLLSIRYLKVKYWRIKLRYLFKYNYKNIIAVGHMGAIAANCIPGKNKNIAYFNDEFPSIFNDNFIATKEIALIKRASIIALPDLGRLEGLIDDINFNISSEEVVEFINAPCWIDKKDIPNIDWHVRLGINKIKKIVLFSGGLASINQVIEMITSVKLWADDFVLVMNSNNLKSLQDFKSKVPHLNIQDKIIWLEEDLTEVEFHSLIASSFCNICLYSNVSPNLYTVGKSSGKAMRSILLGVPVICTDFPSFDFIKINNLGICINHPLELAGALDKLNKNSKILIANCNEYSTNQMDTFQEYSVFKTKFLINT